MVTKERLDELFEKLKPPAARKGGLPGKMGEWLMREEHEEARVTVELWLDMAEENQKVVTASRMHLILQEEFDFPYRNFGGFSRWLRTAYGQRYENAKAAR